MWSTHAHSCLGGTGERAAVITTCKRVVEVKTGIFFPTRPKEDKSR